MIYVSKEKKQRIFIGIPIDKPGQRAIEKLLDPIKRHSRNLRWVPTGNRHLTLAFLGDMPGSDIYMLLGNLASAYQQYKPFDYCLSALERFPNARGRIIALTGEASAPLHSLVMTTRDMLRECGLGYERNKFRPHVTLARIRNPKHPLTRIDRQARVDIKMDRIVLYRSTLTNTGSVYSVLQEVELK